MKHHSIMLICFVIAVGILISMGCARKTHLQKAQERIVSYGPNSFSISYSGVNRTEVRSIVKRAASLHCQEQGKYLSPADETVSGLAVELKFSCENKQLCQITTSSGRTCWCIVFALMLFILQKGNVIKKVFWGLVVFLIVGCASGARFSGVEPAPNNKSAVYFYRPASYVGAAVSFSVQDNGKKVFAIKNGQF